MKGRLLGLAQHLRPAEAAAPSMLASRRPTSELLVIQVQSGNN